MGLDAGTPPGLWERVRKIAAEEVAKFMRSGFLRNASITDGGLTIRGGFLRVRAALAGLVDTMYVGGGNPLLPDGSPQPMVILRRNDGTVALALFDPIPTEGDYNQFLAWYDRQGNIVVSDDTDSGQGIARPYVPFAFYRSRSSDWPTVSTGAFETVYRARGPKQQPRLFVETWLHATAPGAVAELQVLVNGSVWGAAQQSNAAFVTGLNFGPLPVTGSHMSTLAVEVQARIVSGGGTAEVGVGRIEGRQS